MMTTFFNKILQISPLEGYFFGSGKSLVVTGVALIILVGLGVWMFSMEKRLRKMNEDVDGVLNRQNLPNE